jgi:hypothetical protein
MSGKFTATASWSEIVDFNDAFKAKRAAPTVSDPSGLY